MRTQNGRRRGYCAKYIWYSTADPVGMGRKSCLSTVLKYSERARLSALPFCGLIYNLQLIHLWSPPSLAPQPAGINNNENI